MKLKITICTSTHECIESLEKTEVKYDKLQKMIEKTATKNKF